MKFCIKSYLIGIIIPSLFMMATLALLYLFWVKRQKESLLEVVSKIKVIFELVSFKEIENDKDLQLYVA